jgi:hypothetical protein
MIASLSCLSGTRLNAGLYFDHTHIDRLGDSFLKLADHRLFLINNESVDINRRRDHFALSHSDCGMDIALGVRARQLA